MDEYNFKANVFYLFREELYQSAIKTCRELLISQSNDDPFLMLCRSLALILSNSVQEGVDDLQALKSHNDFRLTVAIVSKMAGKMAPGGKSNFDAQIREFRTSATNDDLLNTAFVLYAFKKYEKAFDLVEKLLDANHSIEFLTLRGWIALNLLEIASKNYLNVVEMFELAGKDDRRNLDGSLGLAEAYMRMKDTEEALATINKSIVRFPANVLPIIEKIRLHFAMQDWESCSEIANRALDIEANNLEALMYNCVISIFNFDYEKASVSIKQFFTEVKSIETRNSAYILKLCRLFSNICARNPLILNEINDLAEYLLETIPNDLECTLQLAEQHILQGNFPEAARLYKSATKIDSQSFDGLIGITYCEFLAHGLNEQVGQQVEFLSQLDDAVRHPKFQFLKAKTCKDAEFARNALIELCKPFVEKVNLIPYSYTYLIRLEPDFLLTVIKEILPSVPQMRECILKSRQQTQTTTATKAIEETLTIVCRACPNMHEAAYLLARMQMINGRSAEAVQRLEKILEKNATYAQAHLLLAQILINSSGQFERASQTLEVGLSYNFSLRENPAYFYAIGLIEMSRQRCSEAITAFTTSLSLTDFNKIQSKSSVSWTVSDKATICIQLINGHLQAKQPHEAKKLIEDASREFAGTAEESRLLILLADQALDRNDPTGAVEILEKIKSNEPYYANAKMKLANIFLETKNDYAAYVKCYEEVVEIDPSPESFIRLADAHLHVLNIPQALDAYENAWKCSPNDIFLIKKMGWALETTCFFKRAAEFYTDAIKLTNSPEVKLKLIDLYTGLEKFPDAEYIINEEMENEKLDDLISLQYKSKLLNRLVQIHENSDNVAAAINVLKQVKDNQKRVIKRLTVEDSGSLQDENDNLRNIHVKLAQLHVKKNEHDEATAEYKEGLIISPNDKEILTSLSELYMKANKLELCQQTCSTLLALEPNSEDASVMMADIAFRKVDFDMASIHFTNILNKQPKNWKALVRFIEVQRRTGGLEEIPHYLQQAEKSIDQDVKESGFNFCMAMYEWYSNNLNAALRNFNHARHDAIWGREATTHMIEICLNPDDELFGDHIFDNEDVEYKDSRSMALQTAERLLRDLRQKSATDEEHFKCRMLSNLLLLASKEKSNIERALEDLISINSSDEVYKEHVSVILGVATAHTLLKQGQRAKNQLKRIVKTQWTYEDAEHLERCWLLLADYYVQSSKYDLASELLQRVLLHNRACVKAFELSGYIAEKEQIYKHAANYYDSAWKFGGKQHPVVGYKLAYNLMKCKKYASAIDACQQVLKDHPEYPRIKKDILDKCLNNLRT